ARLAGLDRIHPLAEVILARGSRQTRFRLLDLLELLLGQEDEVAAVVAPGEEGTFLRDQEQPAAGDSLAVEPVLVAPLVLRQLLAAIVPGHGQRAAAVARAE